MSNLNLNKVVLAGRLTADPELKQTTSGVSVLRVNLAVNRKPSRSGDQSEQQTDFFRLVAWRSTAEFISRYFRKGSAICVSGSIQIENWQDQQGQRRTFVDVIVDDALFVDSRNENGGAQGGYMPDAYNATPSYSSKPSSAPNFEELTTDDDLPF